MQVPTEFRCSGQKEKESTLLGSDDLYLRAYSMCVLANTQGCMLSLGLGHLNSIEKTWVQAETGYCDTSQHHWQSLNQDWSFIVDS